MQNYELADLVGQSVFALIPSLNSNGLVPIQLRAVEAAGIWIENDSYNASLKAANDCSSSPFKCVFFIPFSAISYVIWGEPDTQKPGKLVEFPPAS